MVNIVCATKIKCVCVGIYRIRFASAALPLWTASHFKYTRIPFIQLIESMFWAFFPLEYQSIQLLVLQKPFEIGRTLHLSIKKHKKLFFRRHVHCHGFFLKIFFKLKSKNTSIWGEAMIFFFTFSSVSIQINY